MTDLVPLWPELVPDLFSAYQRGAWGWDLVDPQDVAIDLATFAEMVWRAPSVQFVDRPGAEAGAPRLLARLVEVDHRHRSARYECWELEAALDPVEVGAVTDTVLGHGFDVLGLNRIAYALPGFLADRQAAAVAQRFRHEGTRRGRLVRRGRQWDVEEHAVLRGDRP